MKYEQRWFAFIDVLGFAERVISRHAESEQLPAILRELRAEMQSSAREFKEHTGLELTVTLLSDTVIASAPEQDNALNHFFWCLRRIANLLLSKKFLVRGCVLSDKIYHDDQIIVGPAIVHAYRYESKIARFPRLAIIGKLRQHCISDPSVSGFIRQSRDGPWYLHTLREYEKFASKADALGIETTDFRFILDARDFLSEQLRETADQPTLYEKLHWFASYFDDTVIEMYKGHLHKQHWPKKLLIANW